MAFLDGTGLGAVWGRIKTWVAQYANITSSTSNGSTTNTLNIGTNSVVIPNRTSELSNDAGFITGADIPEGAAASSATPLMDGTASAGSSNAFARGDHIHPSDTSKANKPTGTVTAGHIATLDANGNLVDSGKSASNIMSKTGENYTNASATYRFTNTSEAGTGYISINEGTTTYDAYNDPNVDASVTEFYNVSMMGTDINARDTWSIKPNGEAWFEESIQADGLKSNTTADRSTTKVWNTNGGLTDLSNYATTSNIGQANGIASLDSSGKVPSSQLPSYVDDVVEIMDMAGSDPSTCATGDVYYNTTSKKLFTATAANTWGSTGVDPQAGVIYILTKSNHATYSQNSEFRWGGSSMVQLYDGGASALSTAEIEAACPYS